jgi:hypothetical protein
MRTFRLAQVAAEAEQLRLRRRIRRTVTRVILAMVAGVWLVGALGFAHVAAWLWLASRYGALGATLGLMLLDLIVGGGMLAYAMRSGPDSAERQAKEIRDNAWAEIRATLTMTAVIQPLVRLLFTQLMRMRRAK